jgi:3-oxoisoapionate decarboxylase
MPDRRRRRPAAGVTGCGKLSAMTAQLTRRTFLQQAAGTVCALAAAPGVRAAASSGHALGLDNFSVRAMGWKAPQLVDYAASLGCNSIFITDLDAFESLDDDYLAGVGARATGKNLKIQLGTWSVCPTSKAFRPNRGTADEHLALGIRTAKALGSPVIRVVLGTWEDRLTDGGIERHMESLLSVCRRARSQALDAGVTIAIENHAGDMHSTELAGLVESAGTDYVGVNLDSGNALWTLEDPLDNLKNLGKHVVTTSLRDSAVWQTPDGAAVAWTAMGEGQIDLKQYFATFDQLCPGVPVHIETISGFNREIPYLQPEFWKAWPHMPAEAFAHFLALAKHGTPRAPFQTPAGEDKTKAEQAYERGEIESSLRYCKDVLGLGY